MNMATKKYRQTNRSRRSPSRIAFGSCNDQDRQNNLWSIIESRKPAAFVWGGDAIYADEELTMDFSSFPPLKRVCGTPAKVRELYQRQLSTPEYQRFLNTNMTVFGTLDDHDFGCDNADKTFQHKYETTNAFLDFTGEPEDSLIRRRAFEGRGVYGVKLFDFDRPEGEELVPDAEACVDPDSYEKIGPYSSCSPIYSNKTVAVFVLDVRTNKDPWTKGSQAFYSKDYAGDFLGESQWRWFERAISNSRAAVNVVVNGLQVHANLFPSPNIAENWGSFPAAQQRLFDSVLANNVNAPILISGDVHMTQMMRKDCRRRDNIRSSHSKYLHEQRPLFEMTTSGMTHSWGTLTNPFKGDPNFRFQFREYIVAYLKSVTMHLMHAFRPWTSVMVSPSSSDAHGMSSSSHDGGIEGAKKGLQYSLQKNFGELEFCWEERVITIRSIGETPGAPPLLAAQIPMDQLSGGRPLPTTHITDDDFQAEIADEYPWAGGEWVCVPHRGHVSMLREVMGHVTSSICILSWILLPLLLPVYLLTVLCRKRVGGEAQSIRRQNSGCSSNKSSIQRHISI